MGKGSHLTIAACAGLFLLNSPAPARAQDSPQGITTPVVFPAFNPDAPPCTAPLGLMRRLGFLQENDREFLEGVNHGLQLAAQDRGLPYTRELGNSDAAIAAGQLQSLLTAKTGAVIATFSDPDAVRPDLREMILSGGFVGVVGPPPATLLVNAPQYQTGKLLADSAIAYINANLGGKADVVILTQDAMQYLAPRFEAMRDELAQLPNVSIVADIAPQPVTVEGGYKTMTTILQAGVNVDVVLGADAVVLGALNALRAAGKARPDQFIGGIDGEPNAIAEIKKVGSPYKASVALSSPVFGYGIGEYAADWLDGKSVPQAIDVLPIALTQDNIKQYEADLADPASVWRDAARRTRYVKMYGNTCYDTRDRYVNFPWSSETPAP
jgi:ribose transport system substrate-binding protein